MLMLEKSPRPVNAAGAERRPEPCHGHPPRVGGRDWGCKLAGNALASGADAAPAHRGDAKQYMLHVSKIYPKEFVAVSDITLHIQRGEFVFLSGPSGAGKTTLLRLIFRDELPTSGQILVNGRNVVRLRESKLPALRRSIGVIFQDFKLLMDRTVYDNLHLVARVLGVPEAVSRRKIGRLLKEVGLLQKADEIPYKLSGGEQQRVAIARALMSDPAILLADEPTGNLDPDLALDVMRLLIEVNIRGTTVVVATHNRRLVSEMGQRALILKQGRLMEETH